MLAHTEKLQCYIPTYCVFYHFIHYLYGPSHMPTRTMFPRHSSSLYTASSQSPLKCTIRVLLHLWIITEDEVINSSEKYASVGNELPPMGGEERKKKNRRAPLHIPILVSSQW